MDIEGRSSAADCVADVTDVTDRIPDYPSVLPSSGRRKREEGRDRKKISVHRCCAVMSHWSKVLILQRAITNNC